MSSHDPAKTSVLTAIAREAMLRRGLEPDFSQAVRSELTVIEGPATKTDPDVRDLRELPWCSIDNDDSRDLDQLTVAGQKGSETNILVAIADVDALVTTGSAIDAHAATNTTSVYTAAGIFPMLPEKLSTNLTSLGEGDDRLAIVVDMNVNDAGDVAAAAVYRAMVRNHAKLAYNALAGWLDGVGPAPERLASVDGLDAQLRTQDAVAQCLKRSRCDRGALTLETLEVRPVFEAGALADLRPDAKNRAKELIENFMIAANVATATFLGSRGFPSLRRVLQSPQRWQRIVDLAAGLGHALPAAPDARALDAFLLERRASDPARFADLSLSIVKLLGSGEYAVEVPYGRAEGHFGLAVKDYSHSTAPNRRFPDLIAQRLLKAALAGDAPPYSNDELRVLAAHCTEQEDNATKVERQVQKSAAALLLQRRIGAKFDGIVTGASPKGTWVRISRPTVEGRVVRGFEGLDVGDAVRVELLHTDASRGFIDFARAGR
jgi:VacB/RNase II family 3'-5' exoribonuclease